MTIARTSAHSVVPTYALTILVAFFLTACPKPKADRYEFDMGEKVPVGPLTYTIIESQWKSQLGTFPTARIPQSNFLLLRITVTNSGGSEISIPSLEIENTRGDSFTEVSGEGVDRWLGVLRRIPPAGTEEGWILFDVPTNSYRLKVQDLNSQSDRITYVKIPLRLPEGQ